MRSIDEQNQYTADHYDPGEPHDDVDCDRCVELEQKVEALEAEIATMRRSTGRSPYGRLPGHVRDSKTSAEAASVLDLGANARKVIAALFHSHRSFGDGGTGQYGLACWQIERIEKMSHQSASSSLRHLELNGWVMKTDRYRENPHSGRKQTVYDLFPSVIEGLSRLSQFSDEGG